MRIQVGVEIGTYTFDKVAKTITLSGLDPIVVEQVLEIRNVTRNVTLYEYKLTRIVIESGNVISFFVNTTGMDNNDSLQIFIDYDLPGTITGNVNVDNPFNLESTQIDVKEILEEIKAKTDNIDVALSTRTKPADTQKVEGDVVATILGAWAVESKQDIGNAILDFIKAKTDNLDVALSTRTKPSDQQHAIIDNSALPLGASTEAKQDALNAKDFATQTTLALIKADLDLIKAKTDNIDVLLSTRTKPADTQKVDGSAVTQPVSGTVTANTGLSQPLTDAQLRASQVPVSGAFYQIIQPVSGTFFQATQPISAVSLPLPTGAATSAKQDLLLAELQLKADLTETQPVSAVSLPLPTGAATSVLQGIGNTSLSNIDNNTQNLRDIVQEIQMTGLYRGKTGYVFNIIGQRAGFTSTTLMNDVKEYDNAVANIATTSNSTLDIISSSVNDAAAGTGVRTVKVVYINNSNNLVESAAITLNGTTLVTSVLTGVNQVLWMETTTFGSGGVAAGDIRLRINGGTVEVEQITTGGNKSRSGVFMIPTGYTGYVVNWRVSAINQDQDVRLRGTVNTLDKSISTAYHYMTEMYAALNTSPPPTHELYLKLPALARVKASTISTGTSSASRCNVNIIIMILQD